MTCEENYDDDLDALASIWFEVVSRSLSNLYFFFITASAFLVFSALVGKLNIATGETSQVIISLTVDNFHDWITFIKR